MKKFIFLPAILLVFYLAIFSIITFGIIRFQTHDHFAIAIVFEFIGFLILTAVAIVNMIANPPVKTGFFAPLTIATLVYTVILHILNLLLVPFLPTIWGVLINLIFLFVYLGIGLMFVVAGRMDTRPHSGVLTQHTIGREARQEGNRECPHCQVMIPYSVQFCPVCGKPSDPPEAPKPPVAERLTPPQAGTFGGAVQVPQGAPGAPGSAYAPGAQQIMQRPPVQPYQGGAPYQPQGMPQPNTVPIQPMQPPPAQGGAPVPPPPVHSQTPPPPVQGQTPTPPQNGAARLCSCGTPLLIGAKFCPNCGKTVQ